MEGYKQASETFKAQNFQTDAGNGQKNNADVAADGIVFVKSMKDSDFKKGLVPYSTERKEMLLRDSRNIIAENVADVKSFVHEAFSNNKSIKSLHLGRITPELLNRIYLEIPNLPADKQNALFRMDREYSLEIGQEDVRHLIDEKNQLTQEDIIDYVLNLPAIINDFDEVHYTQYIKGKSVQNGLLFRKQLADGKYFAMEIVSKGKSLFGTHNLYMDTADYQKKKKAIQTVPVPKAQGQTPEAPENSPSNNSISEDSESVKQDFSTKDTSPIQAHYAEVLRENNNLRQIISALDEMNYSSARKEFTLNSRDIFGIASKLIKQTSSKYDKKTLADELTVLYDYMANNKGTADSEEILMRFIFQSIILLICFVKNSI